MQKIYISGGITNVPNYEENFSRAERRLKEQGFEVVNPCEISKRLEETLKKSFNQEPTYKEYMIEDITELGRCDAIYMLNNWEKSKGACLEKHFAEVIGLDIMFEEII